MKRGPMGLLKKPGASLLLVGLAMFFVVGPLLSNLPLIGGIIGVLGFVIGVLGIVGGGYLLFRSTNGPGGN